MIHTVNLNLDWKLVERLSAIDRFDGAWAAIEKRENQTLKQLKSMATVRSVGASTRIEGSKMNDDEVNILIENLRYSNLEDRDAQEVVGYFETLNIISESYQNISISENSIKSLHNTLMRHSDKDAWHRGNYKQHPNAVEATDALAGTKQIVFRSAAPGQETEDAMRKLIAWYAEEKETQPTVRTAIFVYDFLSIHPFQDGNGRLSRLIATLLLLKHSYSWIEFVSFEHEIEARKAEYYQVLMECQSRRPGEDVYPWVTFFLSCLSSIQVSLMRKMEFKGRQTHLSPRKNLLYSFIDTHPGARSGEMAKKLSIPLPTVKKLLMELVTAKLISKHGKGRATHYFVGNSMTVKTDLVFVLKDKVNRKEFVLLNPGDFVELKKLVLTPHFEWKEPKEWVREAINNDLYLKVKATNSVGQSIELPAKSIAAMIGPNHYQPVFILSRTLHVPNELWINPSQGVYPIKCSIELAFNGQLHFDFSVIYDASVDQRL